MSDVSVSRASSVSSVSSANSVSSASSTHCERAVHACGARRTPWPVVVDYGRAALSFGCGRTRGWTDRVTVRTKRHVVCILSGTAGEYGITSGRAAYSNEVPRGAHDQEREECFCCDYCVYVVCFMLCAHSSLPPSFSPPRITLCLNALFTPFPESLLFYTSPHFSSLIALPHRRDANSD